MAYYGDDFTGSADAMEALTLNGVPTVLFLDRPDPALLKSRLRRGAGRSASPERAGP